MNSPYKWEHFYYPVSENQITFYLQIGTLYPRDFFCCISQIFSELFYRKIYDIYNKHNLSTYFRLDLVRSQHIIFLSDEFIKEFNLVEEQIKLLKEDEFYINENYLLQEAKQFYELRSI
jgi:hypothetical protein